MYRISDLNTEQKPATIERKIAIEDYAPSGISENANHDRI